MEEKANMIRNDENIDSQKKDGNDNADQAAPDNIDKLIEQMQKIRYQFGSKT